MIRALALVPLLIVVAPVVLVAGAALALFAGSPGSCGGGRAITFDPALAFAYDDRWLAFNTELLYGNPATLTITDSEATSRARFFIDAAAPIDDVRICFVDGGGDVNATLDTPVGPDIDVRVKGTADLTGAHPRADIDSIRLGALPSFVTRPFHGTIERIADDQLERITLDYRLAVDVREGQATITGTP